MIQDYTGLTILMIIMGIFGYCQAPRHWQTPLGFLLIVFGWIPLGALGLLLFLQPLAMVPIIICGVIYAISPRRG